MAAAGLLALVILLGMRQYVLSSQYTRIIEQSEKAIFHFATIRESVTESLIDKRWQRLEGAVPEIEKLNSELARLQESTLVPNEFKLAMVDKVDLAGIIISVRRLMNGGGDDALQSKALQERMREIGAHLLQYDRMISSQARERLLNFQMVIIGALGIIISLAGFAFNRLYKNTVLPVLRLASQMRSEGALPEEMMFGPEVSREVVDLMEEIWKISVSARTVERAQASGSDPLERRLLAETVNETTNQLNGIINYAQILADDDSRSQEERELLRKIIDSGGDIAESWRKIH